MIKWIFTLLIVLLMFCSPKSLIQFESASGIYDNILNSLVYITNDRIAASGVVVKSGNLGSYILTNKHVCQANKMDDLELFEQGNIPEFNLFKIEYYRNRKVFQAQVVKYATNYDLCLLYSPMSNVPAVNLAESPLFPGSRAFYCGNPLGERGICSTGLMSGSRYIRSMLYQVTSIQAFPGSSGSGVFNSDKQLVGLMSLAGPGYSCIVPVMHIRQFLEELKL